MRRDLDTPSARLRPSLATTRVRGTILQLESLARDAAHSLGYAVRELSVFEQGYEDCNVDVVADGARFVLKVFAADRDPGFAYRYAAVVDAARAAGVDHPGFLRDDSGAVVRHDRATENTYVVMERAAGAPVSSAPAAPPQPVVAEVVRQAAALHGIDCVVSTRGDVWSPARAPSMAYTFAGHLDDELRMLIAVAVESWRRIDFEGLPARPIHSDLSRTNVLIDDSGRVRVLDLASVCVYPRIQELAFIAVNLMHGDARDLFERVALVAAMYREHAPLAAEEEGALTDYAVVTAAMEVLGSTYYRVVEGLRSEENDEVLEIGRAGLRSALKAGRDA